MDELRGSGLTTRQMQQAPQGAVYVWCNNVLSYPRELARKLGRDDLLIVGTAMLDPRGAWWFRGRSFPAIVVDHAAQLSSEERESYNQLRLRALHQPPPAPRP